MGQSMSSAPSGSGDQPIRVVVADDEPLVREGVIRILERAGCQVVGATGDADDLRRVTQLKRPDVLVTDIEMPPGHGDDGLQAARDLRLDIPRLSVVVLSQYLDASYVMDLIGDRASGVGYLLKEKVSNPGVLADAVRRVAAGGSALDPDVVARLVRQQRVRNPLDALTPRERGVLALMAEGHSNTAIAARLFVTVAAVERHVTAIFAKLGLTANSTEQHRRVAAVLAFLRQ